MLRARGLAEATTRSLRYAVLEACSPIISYIHSLSIIDSGQTSSNLGDLGNPTPKYLDLRLPGRCQRVLHAFGSRSTCCPPLVFAYFSTPCPAAQIVARHGRTITHCPSAKTN
jgi:hypothetical protein